MITKNLIRVDEKIIKDVFIFSDEYVPNKILFRMDKIKILAENMINPFLTYGSGLNYFILGWSGTGKTITVKHIIKLAKDYISKNNSKIKKLNNRKFIYIEVGKLEEISVRDTIINLLKRFDGVEDKYLKTGLTNSDYLDEFFRKINENKCDLMIVVDEIDKLKKKDINYLFYNLTRGRENGYIHNDISIISIANDIFLRKKIESRVLSSYCGAILVFKNYTREEIAEILKSRAELGLKEKTWDMNVLKIIADYVYKEENGDVRKAIKYLYKASKKADDKLTEDFIVNFLENVKKEELHEAFFGIQENKIYLMYSIVNLMKDKEETNLGNVYEFYKEYLANNGGDILSIQRVIDHLDDLISCNLLVKVGERKSARYIIPRNFKIINQMVEDKIKEIGRI